jgi:hypothetical protein
VTTAGIPRKLPNEFGGCLISLARAFVASGCRAYIGPIEDVDQDAGAVFTLGFVYHLLSRDRDPKIGCTDREAVERASRFDTNARAGTHLFRYYEGPLEIG